MSEEFSEPLASPSDDQPVFKPIEVKFTAMDTNAKPDLQDVQTAVLKEGPRSRKVVKFAHVRDRHTGKTHHDALSIQTYRIQKGQSIYDPKHTISLSSEGEDEIQKLLDFLLIVRGGASTPNFTDSRIVDTPSLIPHLEAYKAATEELKNLLYPKESIPETQFHKLLSENPWMFGSEYSEVVDQPQDEHRDFMVRRTPDGSIELVGIKTPLNGTNLFGFDEASDSYYAGTELSKAISQTQSYLKRLEARLTNGEDAHTIRGKIIIGRDGDLEQRKALRRLNGHLHRIEILTFDQLLRIAERVVGYLENAMRPATHP